jgi:hypothetical protein
VDYCELSPPSLISSEVKDLGIGLSLFELTREMLDEGRKAVCSNFTIFSYSLGYKLSLGEISSLDMGLYEIGAALISE